MGWNDHFDFELYDIICELVDDGELEKGTPAYGIAQQVIHQGFDSLSPKQRYIYVTRVEALLNKQAAPPDYDPDYDRDPD
jgi:hypothetical protein